MEPPSNLLKIAVIALAAANAFLGIASLPLDGHEVFVVQTAQEMHDRGDWIVPYFNDAPRLTKPPLSYWLTGAVAAITPGDFEAKPWQGRLPSAISGIVLVFMAIRLGRLLFGEREGWLAGTIIATSAGFLTYTHSARAEMLYAMLCTGAILSFAIAWNERESARRQIVWGNAQWIFIALAVLAKGPHVPAFLLSGGALFLLIERRGWKQSLRILQPPSGLLIGVALPAAWFAFLDYRLRASGAEGLADSQLSGSLYRIDWRSALLTPYVVTYPALYLPWLVAFPCLIYLRRPALKPQSRLLLCMILATLVPLALAVQHHGYYALPLLAPGATLLAAGVVAAIDAFTERAKIPAWWRWSPRIYVALTVCLLAFAATRTSLAASLVVLAMTSILAVIVVLLRDLPHSRIPAARPLRTISICLAIAAFTLATTQLSWSPSRFDRARTALEAKKFSQTGATIIAYGVSDELLLYYTGQTIVPCGNRENLIEILGRSKDRSAILVIAKDQIGSLSKPLVWSRLGDADTGDELVLSVQLEDPIAASQ